jgi:mannose-6-phosphate isomerase-like protein (cupin superfamily)
MECPRVLMVVTLALLGATAAQPQEPDSPARWEAFTLAEVGKQREATSRPWIEFLKVPSLSAGLYVLPTGGQDGQSPHGRDEVYYVVAGRAVLEVDGDRQSVKAGSVVYVKAEVDHRFVEIEEDLEVLVFFAAAPVAPSTDE